MNKTVTQSQAVMRKQASQNDSKQNKIKQTVSQPKINKIKQAKTALLSTKLCIVFKNTAIWIGVLVKSESKQRLNKRTKQWYDN